MQRTVFRTFHAFVLVGLIAFCPPALAQEQSIDGLIAVLKQGTEKQILESIQELAKLKEKAAPAVPALVKLLDAERTTEDVRLHATMALGKIGSPAVGPVTRALDSANKNARFYAVWALGFIGPPAKSATPAVIKALGDKDDDVRRKAAYVLGHIHPDPKTVMEPLLKALSDNSGEVRQAAAGTLPGLGSLAVPGLLKLVQGDEGAPRQMAISVLGNMGSAAADAVPVLDKLMQGSDAGLANLAANALAGIGPDALPALVASAKSDEQRVRSLALRSMQQIGAGAVPTLVDLLGAKHVDVRLTAANLLGSMNVQDKMVVIGLGYAIKDKDASVRTQALIALQRMGTGAKLAEPYIAAALVDIDPNVRQYAFNTLQNMGIDPRPSLKKALTNPDPAIRIKTASLMVERNLEVELAEPILLEGLKSDDNALKMQVANTLSKRGLQPSVVLPIFMAGLKNDDASVRRLAAEAIGRYGVKAADTTPLLIKALEDDNGAVRKQALTALKQVGNDPKTLFPAMVKLLRRGDEDLAGDAAQVIFKVGPTALPQLIKLLKSETAPGIRLVCLQSVAMAGPKGVEALDLLIGALGDDTPRNRMTAARALGNLGPAAKTAVPALTKVSKADGDQNVRSIAAAAIQQIRADANAGVFDIRGVLTSSDPMDTVRRNAYHVVHSVPMKQGRVYTIDLMATWDTYLRLEDASGRQLALDDDGGQGLNSRLVFRCPEEGIYRIIVTSFGQRVSGPYHLTVR